MIEVLPPLSAVVAEALLPLVRATLPVGVGSTYPSQQLHASPHDRLAFDSPRAQASNSAGVSCWHPVEYTALVVRYL
jgi:hypothetical protein